MLRVFALPYGSSWGEPDPALMSMPVIQTEAPSKRIPQGDVTDWV